MKIKPEYLKKLEKIRKGKYFSYDSMEEFIEKLEK